MKTKKVMSESEKAVFLAQNDAECIKAFEKKGYKDVQPRVTVKTYKKFLEDGLMVRKGEKSTRVGPFNLFHRDQASPVTTAAPNAEGTATIQ